MKTAMKKTLILAAIAAAALSAYSCAVPDEDYVHDDASISAIYICSTEKDATGKELAVSFPGSIDQDAGTVSFLVTKDKRKQIDLTAVKIRANVSYDAFIKVTREGANEVDRTLYGIHDISEGIDLTVTANMTGRTKSYTLTARYEK